MISSWLCRVNELPLPCMVLLKVSILLAAAWALHLILRHGNPYWRMLLWRGFGATIVVTPLLILLTPAIPIAVPASSAPVLNTVPFDYDHFDAGEPEAITELRRNTFATESADAFLASAPAAAINLAPPWTTRAGTWIVDRWPDMLLAAWAAGILLLLSRWGIAWLRLYRVVSASTPAGEQHQQYLHRAARKLRVNADVQLRIAEAVPSPLLAGIRRPVILLPRGMFASADPGELAAVLAHELTHVHNRDLPWMAFLRGLAVVFWWHPLIWRLCRVHSQACEEACDTAAAGFIGDSDAYSRALARLALASLSSAPMLAAIPMARPAELMQRLSRLNARASAPRPGFCCVAPAGVLCAFVAVALSGLQLVDAAATARTDSLATGLTTTTAGGRILHFPTDRSLGMLYVLDAGIQRKIKDFNYWVDGTDMEWEYLGEATGDVAVPADKRVRLRLNDKSGNKLSPLTKLGPDDLYELHLGKSADDRCLPYLAHLTGLKDLEFPSRYSAKDKLPVFTPRGMKQLAKLKSLERLTTPDGLLDAGLAIVADVLPQLKALYLGGNQLTDAGLAVLPKLRSLEELSIGGERITNAGLAPLAKLPSLRYLHLWGNTFTDDALLQVRRIPTVETFVAPRRTITDAGVAHLAGHPKLENLSLFNTKVTDQGLEHLRSLPSLKKLDLDKKDFDHKNPPITNAGTVHLKTIKSLEQLSLPCVGVTDEGLANLAELGKLKYLRVGCISSSPISDAGLKHLSRLRSLEALFIAGKGITAEGISSIAELTSLRELVLVGIPEASDEAMARLATLKSLERLDLTAKKVTISGLNQLNGLPSLNWLTVGSLARDGATLNLSRLPRIEYLAIGGAGDFSLGDEDLACLANMRQLKWLQGKLVVSDAGMAHIAGLTSLERLVIGGPGVTDRGLASLAGLQRLNNLHITGNFTDEGLRQLEVLRGLTNLWIYSGSNLGPAAKERLRKNLPNLATLALDKDSNIDAVASRPTSAHPKSGMPAPDFTVDTLQGAKFTLSEQRGKVVLLHFWATWCSPCRAEVPQLKKLHDGLKQKYGERFVMINVAMDDSDVKVRDLVESRQWSGLHARIGMSPKLATAYGVTGPPDDFLIGPDGRILLNRESPEKQGDTEAVIDRALKG